jgi:Bacterial protein of unknown function (DUF922)
MKRTPAARDLDPDLDQDAAPAAEPAPASVGELLLSSSHTPGCGCVEAAGQNLLARLALAPARERARVLARMHNGIGNAQLALRLSSAGRVAVAREEPYDGAADEVGSELDPSEATELQVGSHPMAPAAAPAVTRPPVTTLAKNCADCNAAVAILNAGTYVGEANVQIQWAGVGEISVTKTKKGYIASTGVSWSINVATSTMEVTDFVWPNMTAADTAAVAAFRAALLAHEEEHFRRVEAALPTLPKTFSATGATKRAAVDALQAKVPDEVTKANAAMQKVTDDYDAKTGHGKTQSAVGGTDVKLTCPAAPPARGAAAAPEAGAAPAP